jgi:hypothetical protein
MNNLKLNRNTMIIGAIILIGAIYFLPKILGNNNSNNSNNNNNTTSNSATSTPDATANLGQIVTAKAVDRDGCPVDSTTTFGTSGPINVVAQGSQVQQGTTIFVRLYYQGNPIEDLPAITADQDYNNTCINFVFEPTQGAAFQPGQYEAEFVVNGNQSDSVTFQVQ